MSDSSITVLGNGRFLRLVDRDGWEYAERTGTSGVVVVVAVVDGCLILTEQFRPPIDARVIDLPAGLAGDIVGQEEEGLDVAAHRELEEETGYRSKRMRYLTHGPTSAGMTTEIVTFFLAESVTRVGGGGGDESEEIEVHTIPLEGINEWLKQKADSGRSIDPKVFVGLYFADQIE